MASKLVLLLLIMVFLVENTLTRPDLTLSSTSEKFDERISFRALEARIKFSRLAYEEFMELEKITIKQGVPVFKKLLLDRNITQVKNEALKGKIVEIRNFVNKIENDEINGEEINLFERFDKFQEIIHEFNKEKNENLSEDEEIIAKSLNENGLNDFNVAFFGHFKLFVKRFIEEVDNFIKGLDLPARRGEDVFINWLEKLKAEEDGEKQFHMFDDLYDQIKKYRLDLMFRLNKN